MRSHFEHDFFGCTRFPPPFGPWGRSFGPEDRGFGPWGRGFGCEDQGIGAWGRGFGSCGRGRPEIFGFGRPGCRQHGPLGCNQSCQRPHQRPEHDRERSPSPTPREGDHGERPTAPEHDNESPVNDCQEQTRCKHHGPSGWDQCRHEQGFRGHRPCGGGPMRGNHHHHWPGPDHRGFGPRHGSDHHGFGPRPRPSDFFDWFGFGFDHPGHHGDRRFGHRRPCSYDRPWGPFASRDCGDCRGRPCCSESKDSQECKKKKSGRKENESCCSKNKDQNTSGDTVLVQRIIVERAPTRPQSI